jgi:hypothetical protein
VTASTGNTTAATVATQMRAEIRRDDTAGATRSERGNLRVLARIGRHELAGPCLRVAEAWAA